MNKQAVKSLQEKPPKFEHTTSFKGIFNFSQLKFLNDLPMRECLNRPLLNQNLKNCGSPQVLWFQAVRSLLHHCALSLHCIFHEPA